MWEAHPWYGKCCGVKEDRVKPSLSLAQHADEGGLTLALILSAVCTHSAWRECRIGNTHQVFLVGALELS